MIFPLKGENCEFPQDSSELRNHILRFLEAGKCTPNIPVMYPAGEVTEVPIANGMKEKKRSIDRERAREILLTYT